MNLEKIHEWLGKQQQVKADEAKLKQAKKELAEIHDDALKYFENEGVTSVGIGDFNVHIRRDLRSSVKKDHGDQACEVLRDLGYGNIVKESVNAQTLSSLVREFDKNDEDIPTVLHNHINVAEIFSVRATKK